MEIVGCTVGVLRAESDGEAVSRSKAAMRRRDMLRTKEHGGSGAAEGKKRRGRNNQAKKDVSNN